MSTISTVIDRFVNYYTALDNQPQSAMTALYHPEAELIDPFGSHQGLFAIRRYFTHLLVNVSHCRFDIDTPLSDEQRFVVTWTMHWSHPKVAGGEALALPGCSVVTVQDGQVIRQRDFYDGGEMLYEHIPVLGWAVRSVKRRVRA
ncbi:ketosteroid isomerase-like protein [Enterobacter sp. BIGb0383]|uniref:nuclear transport factor 2 family protein n=1 Tax=unclassified Enterobacter TaxID=2608935 RepID=UPI000F49DD29|nr:MULTISPECIES: nuclear transport factor 2 family protein [unclassified Enterobacter]ROP61737.1 ketosteroid isomerase-like protein [Enterobacter sp. BIGb0383]ROS11898.1 ketosteroid isomerase-like protein [Enterobacter sp. BIGb0359]